ncbi:MAG: outer rane efflux protein, partial [Gemmatimonadetes bacterium]|nr:outer rane efflux protein [Gemmatimonadota bacterium]
AAQAALQEQAAAARLGNLAAERLPQLGVRAEATRQSDVTSIPVTLPGVTIPQPPKDRYQATLNVDQLVWDGGALRRREDVERARLAETQADVRSQLFALRAEVDEAFFGAFLLQERLGENAALLRDLEARLAQVRAQLRAGTALPGDTASLLAKVLSVREDRAEVEAGRRASLAVLSSLAGRSVGEADVLALPALADEVARVRTAGGPAQVRARPEYERFAATRDLLARQADVVTAQARPQVRAVGQAGVGRPGPYQQFSRDVHDFWNVGVRVDWRPWDWGVSRRQREELAVRQQVAGTEEASFARRLERQVQQDAEAMDRLVSTLETDDRIIALREQVERQATVQFRERAITAAQYVDAVTDVYEARVTRRRHRVELARARARYLTTLGVEVS